MKILLLLLVFLTSSLYAGTCTSISRTNSSALSVLTSTKYNLDNNTAYSAINAFDGGCVTSGTLEFDALDTAQFAPILSGSGGCKVSYSSASTVSIGRCREAVNGNLINKSGTTSASFGCPGCSSEVASTTYYAYIATGSTGSTINPLILTTAPNEDGYDNTGNKVLAKFYNNASSDIDQYSIEQWSGNGFITDKPIWTAYTPTLSAGFGTVSNRSFFWRRVGDSIEVRGSFTCGVVTAAVGSISIPSGMFINTAKVSIQNLVSGNGPHIGSWIGSTAANSAGPMLTATGTSSTLVYLGDCEACANHNIPIAVNARIGNSYVVSFTFNVPIEGWQ